MENAERSAASLVALANRERSEEARHEDESTASQLREWSTRENSSWVREDGD